MVGKTSRGVKRADTYQYNVDDAHYIYGQCYYHHEPRLILSLLLLVTSSTPFSLFSFRIVVMYIVITPFPS